MSVSSVYLNNNAFSQAQIRDFIQNFHCLVLGTPVRAYFFLAVVPHLFCLACRLVLFFQLQVADPSMITNLTKPHL